MDATTPKVMANRIRRAFSQDSLVRRVEAIGACLAPNLGRPSGADRLSALASRVRTRSSPPCCVWVAFSDYWAPLLNSLIA